MGAGDEVIFFDQEVIDRCNGQIGLPALPVSAIIQRDVDTTFRATVEQTGLCRVSANDTRVIVQRDAIGDLHPGLAIVGGLVEIGGRIIQLIARGRHIAGGGVVGRRLQRADKGPLRQLSRRHLLPGGATITGEVDQPIIAADPEDTRLMG